MKELWQVKDSIARAHGNDVASRVAELRKLERLSGREIVDLRAERQAAALAASRKEP